jgi:hypothetical protein
VKNVAETWATTTSAKAAFAENGIGLVQNDVVRKKTNIGLAMTARTFHRAQRATNGSSVRAASVKTESAKTLNSLETGATTAISVDLTASIVWIGNGDKDDVVQSPERPQVENAKEFLLTILTLDQTKNMDVKTTINAPVGSANDRTTAEPRNGEAALMLTIQEVTSAGTIAKIGKQKIGVILGSAIR